MAPPAIVTHATAPQMRRVALVCIESYLLADIRTVHPRGIILPQETVSRIAGSPAGHGNLPPLTGSARRLLAELGLDGRDRAGCDRNTRRHFSKPLVPEPDALTSGGHRGDLEPATCIGHSEV